MRLPTGAASQGRRSRVLYEQGRSRRGPDVRQVAAVASRKSSKNAASETKLPGAIKSMGCCCGEGGYVRDCGGEEEKEQNWGREG